MAIRIPTEGNVSGVKPANGQQFTLEELQHFVGYWAKPNEWKPGYIEPVFFGDYVLIVNEDGLLLHLPFNQNVYVLMGREIVGNAVLLTSEEWAAANASDEDEDEADEVEVPSSLTH